jgi:hypothetical protein
MLSKINMDRDIHQKMLINLVPPDINRKMPMNDRNVVLQQGGATTYLHKDDDLFKAKMAELLGDSNAVKLYTQLTQSLDLNVNDLCFFHSLQSRYCRTSAKTSVELIDDGRLL